MAPKIHGTRAYTYDKDANRLSSVRQGASATRAFAYDAAGNRVSETRGKTAYNYAINSVGRIRALSLGPALKSTYAYDALVNNPCIIGVWTV